MDKPVSPKDIISSLYDYAVVDAQNSEEYDEMYKSRLDLALSQLAGWVRSKQKEKKNYMGYQGIENDHIDTWNSALESIATEMEGGK